MGGGFSKAELLTVDDDPKSTAEKLDPNSFPVKRDFKVLKIFCNKHEIEQKDVSKVFRMYLTSAEAYLRKFQIAVIDIKGKFLDQTKNIQVREGQCVVCRVQSAEPCGAVSVCSLQCAVCSAVQCSVQCAVCSVQCAVCSVQCAVCSVQCAV
jgi:hypothetical protein